MRAAVCADAPAGLRPWGSRLRLVALPLLLLGLWQGGQGAWIHAKAWLAQRLLMDAWERTLEHGPGQHPWPGADTWPVARLQVPRLGVDTLLLAGASARNLAFGGAHLDGTEVPGGSGNSVLAGHRDTHFSFLRWLQSGDRLRLQAGDGTWVDYRVAHMQVVDQGDIEVLAGSADRRLTLVTCYPFRALAPGGPGRYVVTALGVP